MAPFKLFLGTSIAVAFFLDRYAHVYLPNQGFIATAFQLLALETVAWLVWRCLLYPNFFSPLRTLPGPPVSPLPVGYFSTLSY